MTRADRARYPKSRLPGPATILFLYELKEDDLETLRVDAQKAKENHG